VLPTGADAEQGASGAYADVPARFERAGVTPMQFHGERRGPLPQLVYLACGVDQMHGNPVLAYLGFTAVTLGSMLGGNDARRARPVVILDPPRPYSLSEAVECLYWRNLFAEQLMETGTVSAVLALGLAPHEQQRRNLDRLFETVTEGAELATLLVNIRSASHDDDDLDRVVALRAPALFTQHPQARIRPLQIASR
jgi:hypothetical protein